MAGPVAVPPSVTIAQRSRNQRLLSRSYESRARVQKAILARIGRAPQGIQMRLSHSDECDWSPEDQVTFRKWCRGVLVFYGCVFLALLAALGSHSGWERWG